MNSDILSTVLALFGVVIGAFLTFVAQYLLHGQQEKSDVRKMAIDLKNERCLAILDVFADTYWYLFFSGSYTVEKIDLAGLGEHIKQLNVAIIKAEPFISHQRYRQLMKVRNTLNGFFIKREAGISCSGDEHMTFIERLEKPMNEALSILCKELSLVDLGIRDNDQSENEHIETDANATESPRNAQNRL